MEGAGGKTVQVGSGTGKEDDAKVEEKKDVSGRLPRGKRSKLKKLEKYREQVSVNSKSETIK